MHFCFPDFRSLSCKYIRYTGGWESDLAKEDVGIESDVYFTQSFVAKMRWVSLTLRQNNFKCFYYYYYYLLSYKQI